MYGNVVHVRYVEYVKNFIHAVYVVDAMKCTAMELMYCLLYMYLCKSCMYVCMYVCI